MMQRALELAALGMGSVSPNPLVGCVIVKDGSIIGEGYHVRYGEAHAEPNAIRDAESRGHVVQGSTVYVTLEPHSHVSRTPPCCDLLIEKKVGRCVIALQDPNPQVNGAGIQRMLAAGIEVETGLLADEAMGQNRFFVKYTTTGRPYVTLKLASSFDGRSALSTGESRWITSEASRRIVHRMRHEHDAVMVGSATARADDPELTVRLVDGRQPIRIVLDTNASLPEDLRLFTDEHRTKTVVFSHKEALQEQAQKVDRLSAAGVKTIGLPVVGSHIDLDALFQRLGMDGVASVLVEAGATLAASLVQEELADEIALFIAPMALGADALASIGAMQVTSLADAPNFPLHSIERVEGSDDILVRYRRARKL